VSLQEKDNPLEKIPRSEILVLHYSEIKPKHSITSRNDSMLKESLNNVPIFYNIKTEKGYPFMLVVKLLT
jgi:hypothetical protein